LQTVIKTIYNKTILTHGVYKVNQTNFQQTAGTYYTKFQ